MSAYINYFPISPIGKAMFNFDAFGVGNYRLIGTIRVSTSDNFSYADYQSLSYSDFSSNLYTSAQYSSEFSWTPQMIANVQEILGIYQQFANISFTWQGDYDFAGTDTTVNPEDVGRANLSDIDITWTYRADVAFAGISGGGSDNLIFRYAGGAGDIFLNGAAAGFGADYSLDVNTRSRQVLMHELGHSLGLSHPHLSYANGVPTISSDYAATVGLGFQQLGFAIDDASDMYKEYFTIMSYDDQVSLMPGSSVIWHAHTPMILDVIGLQEAYGEGAGTTGVGDDTVLAGTAGYRTYFDKGGIDTIDMSIYTEGAYLNLGVAIAGAPHLVGVGMSAYDAAHTILDGGNPAHLRWFYGEFENAKGSSWSDLLVGNWMSNTIAGMAGDDFISGEDGNDTLEGGSGNDELLGGAGNDVFDRDSNQRGGDDTLIGGTGDDIYVLDSVLDVIVEEQLEGIDTVYVGFNYSLEGTSLENLQAFSDQHSGVIFVGNLWGNVISGGLGSDILRGNEGNDSLRGGGGNDIIAPGEGDDSVDGGDGNDTVVYLGSRSTYSISLSSEPGMWTIGSLADGIDQVGNVETFQFSDGTFSATAALDGFYHFFVVAFAAAPGVEYMNQLAEAYNYGLTLKEIVNIFTTKTQFTSVYPESLSNEQLATQLVSNIVKNSASEQSKAEAVHDIEGALAIGWSRGDVIYQVFANLAAKPLSDATWGNTALQFLNQTAVARYYTEVMHQSTTDLPTLRAVVGDVTPYTDVSTPEAIATLIGVELSHVSMV